jgi:hypothetical protein
MHTRVCTCIPPGASCILLVCAHVSALLLLVHHVLLLLSVIYALSCLQDPSVCVTRHYTQCSTAIGCVVSASDGTLCSSTVLCSQQSRCTVCDRSGISFSQKRKRDAPCGTCKGAHAHHCNALCIMTQNDRCVQ